MKTTKLIGLFSAMALAPNLAGAQDAILAKIDAQLLLQRLLNIDLRENAKAFLF